MATKIFIGMPHRSVVQKGRPSVTQKASQFFVWKPHRTCLLIDTKDERWFFCDEKQWVVTSWALPFLWWNGTQRFTVSSKSSTCSAWNHDEVLDLAVWIWQVAEMYHNLASSIGGGGSCRVNIFVVSCNFEWNIFAFQQPSNSPNRMRVSCWL